MRTVPSAVWAVRECLHRLSIDMLLMMRIGKPSPISFSRSTIEHESRGTATRVIDTSRRTVADDRSRRRYAATAEGDDRRHPPAGRPVGRAAVDLRAGGGGLSDHSAEHGGAF